MFPLFTNFYYSTDMGSVTIPSFLGLSYGLVVFLVILMAIGAFAAAEWSEKNLLIEIRRKFMKSFSNLNLNKNLQ